MNIIKTLLTYIETIVNIFSNALVQTFLVYTTVVLIYKFFIEEQTINYIPTFITKILDKVRNTFVELDYAKNQYQHINQTELEHKYENASTEEVEIHKINKEHNAKVINNALKMSIGILAVFILFAIITSQMSVKIHWYQLLLSAAITVVGTSYEYFFITQIIVKYHFIELTKVYDAMVDKLETISDVVVNGGLVKELKNIVNEHDSNNVNSNINNSINNLVKSKNTLQNAITENNMNNIVSEVSSGIMNQLSKNKNNNNIAYNQISVNNLIDKAHERVDNGINISNNDIRKVVAGNLSINNLIEKAGTTLNDTEHFMFKNLV